MFDPANGICNYLAPEKVHYMLILQICAFSPAELQNSTSNINYKS